MPLAISGTLPTGLSHEDIRVLLRAGKNDEAIVKLCAIIVIHPDDLIAKELLFDAYFQSRNWQPAVVLIEQLVARQPQAPRLRKALIATLSNMKRYQDAIAQASQYVERHGEDAAVLDVLKVAHFYSGRQDEAIRYGQRVIELRDAEACRNPLTMALNEPSGRQGHSIISFALWGPAPIYSYGAMINLVLSRSTYPGWTCRFYLDAAVPRPCVDFLKANGAEVRKIEDEYPGVGLFQRFLVMNDPSVVRFLVRDCDSRLSAAEAELVTAWIDSGYAFHVVRDHVLHNELMIGGLWAGRADCGIDIVNVMRHYFVQGPTAKYGHDQRMLGQMIWPIIRSHCLVHDKYYRLPGVHTLPLADSKSHFGAGHQNLAAVLGEVDRLGIPRVL